MSETAVTPAPAPPEPTPAPAIPIAPGPDAASPPVAQSPAGPRATIPIAPGPEAELLSGPEVAAVLGIGLSCFHKLRKTGRLPLPLRFCRAPRWRRRELLDWINAGMPQNSCWKWQKAS